MIRSLALVVIVLLMAVPAMAQSKSESFATKFDANFDGYVHFTAYEFTLPTAGVAGALQDAIVDVYYNTRRVWLVEMSVNCRNDADTRWIEWAATTADNHIASLRTGLAGGAGTRCQTVLAFANNPSERYVNSPQKAALRLNVSVAGLERLVKTNPLDTLAAGAWANVDVQFSEASTPSMRIRERIAAATP